jgi:hypothetical protein
MQNLITEYYGHLVAALSTPNIITERIRIGDVELMNFDDTKPVYLQQYGRYFAVLEITAQADGTAEVQMLALSEGGAAEEPEPPTPPTPVLPYDAEVEYLSFDGNQYIDTLVTPNETIEAEVDVVVTNTQGSTGLLSSRTSTNFNVSSQSDLSLSIWTNGSKIALNDKNYDSGWKNGITNGIRFVASIKERKLYVDNTLIATSSSTTSYSFDVSYGLLRGHHANGNWDTRKGVSGKLYGCKIWKNNVLVYDVIPVRVGQVGYMYDKVSRQLFGNAGTGAFTLGNDKNT